MPCVRACAVTPRENVMDTYMIHFTQGTNTHTHTFISSARLRARSLARSLALSLSRSLARSHLRVEGPILEFNVAGATAFTFISHACVWGAGRGRWGDVCARWYVRVQRCVRACVCVCVCVCVCMCGTHVSAWVRMSGGVCQ